MGKIKFEDNLAYPYQKEKIEVRGCSNPFKIYYKIKGIMKDVLELSGKDIFEIKLKWDATSEDRSFWVKWSADRKIDIWTKLNVTITISGSQNANTKKGDIAVSITPLYITEVDVGFIKKIFWWIYYLLHYKKKRIRDFYYAKNLINKLKIEIGKVYGVEVPESK
ncbi:MAG: hypothetical protein B6U88_02495 [Candidatus Aenigmarchaeota archaeon ex4484_56]|nr:MAG: hypothetical protein B6U88_02495 [Candidatus Aenigmarchaeota archaeon ex4484_56]